MKKLLHKYEQVIKYLFFGVTTTVVGWVVYFGVLMCGRALLGLESDDVSSIGYLGVYTAAQIIQWVAAVLVAFFTNRKWVFTDRDTSTSTAKQLVVFAGGRVLTLVLDYGVTYVGTLGLCALIPAGADVLMLGRTWNVNEIAAKLVAAVLVIIGNYFFSKLVVFKKKNTD